MLYTGSFVFPHGELSIIQLRGQLFAVDPYNLIQTMLAEGKRIANNKLQTGIFSRFAFKFAITSVMTALIAVTTMLGIPMPPPLSTLTLAPIAIFVTGILLGPIPALIASALGSGIGLMGGATVGTINVPSGFLGIYLAGIMIARGPMGFSVGLLRKKDEVVAMIIGVLVETAIFFSMDSYLFGFSVALIDLGTLIDLVHVSIGYSVLKGVRKMLNITYLT